MSNDDASRMNLILYKTFLFIFDGDFNPAACLLSKIKNQDWRLSLVKGFLFHLKGCFSEAINFYHDALINSKKIIIIVELILQANLKIPIEDVNECCNDIFEMINMRNEDFEHFLS